MTVLIVDDEILIRTKIKYILEVSIPSLLRNEESFVCCGEASNGEEALIKIEKLHPDIVISDMKMPVMDGIALCRACREQYPDIAFIVLSNYDDFSYVKETLMLGAVDYLLKHTLDEESLARVLAKTAGDMKERTREKERTGSRITALKEDVVRNLLGGVYPSERQIALDMKTFDLPLSLHRVVPVMMWIREYQEGALRENQMLSFSVNNIVNEILEDQKNGAICHADHEKYALLFGYEKIHSEQKIRELLVFSLNRIRFCMNSFLGLSVFFIIGRMQSSILSVGEEYHTLETIFRNSFYQEKDIWTMDQEVVLSQTEMGFSPEEEKRLMYNLTSGNDEGVRKQLGELLEHVMDNRPSEMNRRLILIRVLDCFKKAAQEIMIREEELFEGDLSEEQILEIRSFQQTKTIIGKISSRFFALKDDKKTEKSPYIQKAVSYLHQHYRENISQTDAAEYAGISPVYLSILFKNELEDTFPSYLKNLRLKEAERLLLAGNTNLKEVAFQSGFQDYTYFLKCFKKKLGCTPKEYIRKQDLS